jgi:hypothetical protein
MHIARGLAAFIAAALLTFPSYAATVMPEQGIVLVNHGSGYKNATGPTTVNPGDIVVVNPGGIAWLSYPDGCTVQVAVGSIVTVATTSPCATQGSLTPSQASIPPAEGTEPSEPEEGPDTATTAPFNLPDLNVIVPGALLGGTALAVFLAQDKQASP